MTAVARPFRRPRPVAGGEYEEYHPYGSTAWWAGAAATVSQKRYRYTGMARQIQLPFSEGLTIPFADENALSSMFEVSRTTGSELEKNPHMVSEGNLLCFENVAGCGVNAELLGTPQFWYGEWTVSARKGQFLGWRGSGFGADVDARTALGVGEELLAAFNCQVFKVEQAGFDMDARTGIVQIGDPKNRARGEDLHNPAAANAAIGTMGVEIHRLHEGALDRLYATLGKFR